MLRKKIVQAVLIATTALGASAGVVTLNTAPAPQSTVVADDTPWSGNATDPSDTPW